MNWREIVLLRESLIRLGANKLYHPSDNPNLKAKLEILQENCKHEIVAEREAGSDLLMICAGMNIYCHRKCLICGFKEKARWPGDDFQKLKTVREYISHYEFDELGFVPCRFYPA